MKNIFLFIVIIPIVLLAQNTDDYKTIIPYADLNFENNMVVYTIGNTQLIHIYRLSPVMYDKNLLAINYSNELSAIDGNYIKKSQKAIREYVNSEPVGQLAANEKNDYLKLCALLLIWDNDLSKHAVKELGVLTTSGNEEIKGNAEMVGKLLEFYRENGRK